MSESFYNTINLSGDRLTEAEKDCRTQEEKIEAFFKDRPGRKFPPSEVHNLLRLIGIFNAKTPVTSTRRAMTNLTEKNILIMLDEMKDGPLGKPEHLWMLKQTYEQLTFF